MQCAFTMTMNTNNDRTEAMTLEALASQVAALTAQITSLKKAATIGPENVPEGDVMHPMARRILNELDKRKEAIPLVELAKQFKEDRASVHYHVKRLVNKGFVRRLTIGRAKHNIDLVFMAGLIKIPGVDKVTAEVAK